MMGGMPRFAKRAAAPVAEIVKDAYVLGMPGGLPGQWSCVMAILRAWVLAFLVLTVFYWLLRVYFRSTRREALEKRFEAEGLPGDRDTWVEAQMAGYGRSLHLKLLWLVYILPMAGIAVTVYLVNYD